MVQSITTSAAHRLVECQKSAGQHAHCITVDGRDIVALIDGFNYLPICDELRRMVVPANNSIKSIEWVARKSKTSGCVRSLVFAIYLRYIVQCHYVGKRISIKAVPLLICMRFTIIIILINLGIDFAQITIQFMRPSLCFN